MRTPRPGSRWSRERITRRALYDSYMNSKAWQDKRREWYARWLTLMGTPPRCLVCGRRWTLRTGQLHHLTYMRLGAEEPEDLLPLCAADHVKLHELFDNCATWRRLGRSAATAGIIAVLRRRHPARASGLAS